MYDEAMKKHIYILALVLPLLIAAGACTQQDPAGKQGADAQIEALIQEHEESELGYAESYKAFKPRFTKFAENHRGTEAEARAVLWLVQQCWWLREEGSMEETALPLAEYLIKEHGESPQLGLLVEYQYVLKKDQRKELCNKMLEVSPHSSVKAAAHFGLARLGPARSPEGEPNPHYQALMMEYANEPWRLTTFGAIANAYLNPHSADALAVGETAPEIVGVNHKGEPMRLSDYRGKVVMLDFWGNW